MKCARVILALGVTLLVTACHTVAGAGGALGQAIQPSLIADGKQAGQSLVHRQTLGITRPVADAGYAAAPFASSRTQRNLLIAGAVVVAVIAAALLLGDDEGGGGY